MLRYRRRWIVATFVLVVTAIAYVDRVNLSVAAPVITKEFGTNAAVMGVLLSSFTWTYTLLNLPAGMLVDRMRIRVLYALALLVWSVSSFLTALVTSIGALFGPRLLLGVGEAPFAPAAIRTLADWLPKSERATGSSMFISGVALGSAVGPPGLAALVSGYGWQAAFVASGVLSLLAALIWYAWYRHPLEDTRLTAEERELIMRDQEPPAQQGRAPWSAIVRHRDIWAITGGYFCLLYILYTFITWLPSYLVEDRGLTVLGSGVATSIPWAVAFVAGILGGRISDAALRRGVSTLNARKIVLVGGMVAALAILGTALASSAWLAILFLAISTSGIIVANGAVWAATQDLMRALDLAGSATGFVNALGNVGGIIGPIATGALAYATGSFLVPLGVAAGLALLGAIAWGVGMRSEPKVPAGAAA
ncbi:MFS transporter [Pseudonocardia endophytica]|uniref:Sugar phosphate permease n=1 Tax=Pseudonocardia endophytica TaxID=401976 RepID=A0A4V2PJB7_PSEEN|nr:MFS transporter [Pseudonocardia endophytica]TCK27876.1 sugar phosphate permease [Pseudonocardia endophytica]